MPEDPPNTTSTANRRSFLRTAAWGGGMAGLGGLAGLAVRRLTASRPEGKTATPALGDEFTYDVTRFQKSDPALLRYHELARFPVGLERARNIAAGADGSIYLAGTGGIRRFSANGEPMLTIPLEQPVYSIAVRPSGAILAGQAGRITTFDAAGTATAVWTDGLAAMLPTSIAFARDFIFVADSEGRVLLKLGATGRKLATIGARDPANNIRGFVVPSPYFCVRMAPDGLLRVTNPGEHQIEVYTLDGALETAWGVASFAIDGFCGCCNPVSFDIFPDGGFVTCEKGLPRVKLYNSHGEFTGLVAGPEAFPEYLKAANAGTPHALGTGIYAAIAPQGRVLVLDVVGGTVRIMQRNP